MRFNTRVIHVFVLFVVIPTHVYPKEEEEKYDKAESCAVLYKKGVDAYLENRYGDCVKNLEEALQKYRSYTKALQNCRIKCAEDAELSDPLYPTDLENLRFYEKTLRTTLCIMKCRKSNPHIPSNPIDLETEKNFEEYKPYEYLNLCYFQAKQPQKAASAAFTYLVAHPNDEAMAKSLKYYSNHPEIDINDVVNLEAKDYIYLYIHGVDTYEKKDWKAVEANMEESLISYLQSEEECRAQCEGPFVQDIYPDFIPSIANHFAYCLKCKQKCSRKMNNLNGEYYEDLLPSHYHYLQFAYYKTGNMKAACQAAASYVLFYPDDETMRSNMEYYRKLPKVEASYFTPRPEAIHYVRRSTYERRLLKFIQVEYNLNNSETESKEKTTEQDKTTNDVLHIQLIMDEKDLNGTKRFVSDGLAREEDCKDLLELGKLFAQQGDGYKGNVSPHTNMERFDGLTIGRSAILAYFGFMNPKALELYLKITEMAKQHLVERFNVKKKLYFNYTHLVCRSALSNSSLNRTDFSHAIHGDNCNLLENGLCEKLPPAFTWRDYSAILYLNHDFKGGEFIFSGNYNGTVVQSSIRPKCGRMVGFSSGGENLHGVRAVKQGTRCAVALWFTFNKKYAETERNVAYEIINQEYFQEPPS